MQRQATLKWITPNAEKEIVNIARVTNLNPPENTPEGDAKLLAYMMKHGHVSPFQMASMCIEIYVERDISRQILRHSSFSFQEFSYRYSFLQEGMLNMDRDIRLKHKSNRQMSIVIDDESNPEHIELVHYWNYNAKQNVKNTIDAYNHLANTGLAAPETIRAILPEGMVMSHLYMAGNIRSWIFYLKERTNKDTVQYEHYLIAKQIEEIFKEQMPIIWNAFFGEMFTKVELEKALALLAKSGYKI